MPCLLCCSIFLAAIFIPAGGFVPVHPTIYHTKQWQYGGSTSIKRKLSRAATSILMAQTSSSCPFSKAFPRYKIDLTRMSTAKKKDRFSLPFVSDIQKSSSCSKLQQKFNNIPLRWMEKDEAPIDIYFALWSLAADVSDSSSREVTAVLAIPDNSHLQLAQYWVDILNWMQDQDILQNCAGNEKLEATIYQEGDAVAVKLKRTGDIQSSAARQTNNDEIENDATILNKRTQSWVKRILVDQGICPFTKSVKVSGQGLGDLGIPVARIHYCSSNARLDQISKLMTDTWQEIMYMLQMGPSGKLGISSILLAAPEFDVDFDLWSGPIFAMLEAGVVACGLEKEVGVVCFHPYYATPDGSSLPGFGHMHSVPRLQKWVQEQDPFLAEQLSQDEIAAGGAWQRRTPHATINVLRADQLAAAEGRRVTGELYAENIRKLVGKPDGIGSDKLTQALEQERALR